MPKQSLLWFAGFVLILMMAQVQIFISFSSKGNFLGLPNWLFYFVGLHLLYILGLYSFSKRSS